MWVQKFVMQISYMIISKHVYLFPAVFKMLMLSIELLMVFVALTGLCGSDNRLV